MPLDTGRMDGSRYRSYVVRVWRPRDAGDAGIRVVVEEVQSGQQVELRGGPATALASVLAATLPGAEARSAEDEPAVLSVPGIAGE